MRVTIGSLFDGSGGFPLAGSMCGFEPVWASEVEPYPIAVTKSRFPNMKHLGSVTDIKGDEVDPVDVITFGSPCQDLSVAGKRVGLKHEANGDDETTRSGLFMEAIRIIKEMRRKTNGAYPSFVIWENVPGAFSSNRGEDFRLVLTELIRIVEPTAVMPKVPKAGWNYADSFTGDGWSLAYRVFDAQYWGVPQRRRRIYLVLALRGERAGEILFERQGLRGYFTEGRTPWQTATGDAESSIGSDDSQGECIAYGWPLGFRPENVRIYDEVATTLCNGTRPGYTCGVVALEPGIAAREGGNIYEGVSGTLRANSGDNQMAVAYGVADRHILDDQGGSQISVRDDGKCPTLRAETHGNVPCVLKEQLLFENHSQDSRYKGPLDVCPMLPAQLGTGGNNQLFVVESKVDERHPMDSRIKEIDGVSPTVSVKWHKGAADTPLVCETLPIHDQATRFSGKHGDKSDGKGNGLGVGNIGDPMNTLTGGDRHAVAYGTVQETGLGWWNADDVATTLRTPCGGDATKANTVVTAYGIGNGQVNQTLMEGAVGALNCMHDQQAIVYGVDCRNSTEYHELYPTLQAKPNGGQSLNYSGAVRGRYIVRRLTPTECARLQGFADRWGHPNVKTDLTDEEYRFWKEVRNTHVAINGKTVKEYTKEQILKWYNGLHTDSSEYKMWGNGIALPCALYVMQGIEEAIRKESRHDSGEV